jgi:hypothetical protein
VITLPPKFGGGDIAKARNADMPNPQKSNLALESGSSETSPNNTNCNTTIQPTTTCSATVRSKTTRSNTIVLTSVGLNLLQADRVCEIDQSRPSLFEMGNILQIDSSELEFMSLKAPLVLFILDRRIAKVVGLPKMPAIISKILLRARKGKLPGNALSTDLF